MKGIWNRLRLALLGGILAFAGAGMISPLAGGVVAEAAPGDYVQITSADQLKNGQYVLGDVDSYGLVYTVESNWGRVSTTEEPLVFTLELGESQSSFWLGCDSGYLTVPNDNGISLSPTKPSSANLMWVETSGKFGIGNSERLLMRNNDLRFYKTSSTYSVAKLYWIEEAITSGDYVESIEVSPSSINATSGHAVDLSEFQVTASGEAYEHYTAEIGSKTGDSFVARDFVEPGVTLYAIGDNCIRFTANDPISAENDGHAYADVTLTLTVPEATSVTVDPSEAATIVGGTIQLTATVLPAGASQSVTWSTEDTDIVSVSDSGLVTGLKGGEATVTATTENGKTGNVTITVSDAVVGQTRLAGNDGQTDVQGVVSGNTAVWDVKDRFTLTQYKNSSSNVPNVSYEEIRIYASHSVVFEPAENVRITLIEVKVNSGKEDLSKATFENATKSGSDSDAVVTPVDGTKAVTINASAQIRIDYFIVHWTYAMPVEFGTLASVEVNTTPTRLSYMTGDMVSLDGLSILAYDTDGNSEAVALDDEGISITPAEGYVFTEEDVGDHQAVVSYTRGDVTVSAETTWTYHVEVLQTTEYVKATSVNDILLGDEIIIVGTNGGKTYAMGAQSGNYRGSVEIDAPVDGKITIPDNVSEVARITVRVSGVAEGSLSLYDGEGDDEGYLASGNSTSNNVYTNDSVDGNSSWLLGSSGDSLTLTAVEGNAEQPRISFRFNYNNGNPRFNCYQITSNVEQFPHVEIYVREHVAADQAAELTRYMMETDTQDQCLTKFEIAKDAYLNRMGEDGRELFKTGDEYLDAKTRYEAWASYLGQLPYEKGAVQAFRFFNGNEGSMNWAIAGASLGIAVLGAAGYLFYRKKKVAR